MDFICHLDQIDLEDYVKKVFGNSYSIENVTKMQGGAQKVVYKIDCKNDFSCIMYVWDISKNYFKEEIQKEAIHSRSYGGDLFQTNNKFFKEKGIPTPTLYNMNTERYRYPFDYALVEYIDGQKSDFYFNKADVRITSEIFRKIGNIVLEMHSYVRGTYGKVNQIGNRKGKCHEMQIKNAKSDLIYISQHLDDIQVNHSQLLDKLYELEQIIEPRDQYGFIHGELGPDHILINKNLEPYFIDIEGAEFFDIEHEHSFLEFRFGKYYQYLKHDNLDPNRMLFYRFHHHISLTAGFLKLLHRGFPNQQLAIDVINHHSRKALSFINR